jgi:hypothetical protein
MRNTTWKTHFAAVAVALLAAAGCGRSGKIEYWFVDSLVKVFPEDAAGTSRLGEAGFEAARNSHVSIQLALRAREAAGDLWVDALPLIGPGMPIEPAGVRWVEYVVVTSNTTGTPPEELVKKAPALFPDALLEEFPLTLRKNQTRALWLTVHIAANQEPGLYRGVLRVRQGTERVAEIPYRLRVHAATVPSPVPLHITNYFNLNDSHLQQFYGCAQFSDAWWELIRNMARFMGRYHQTSIWANPVRLVRAELSGGVLRYDFRDFERFVETHLAAGVSGPVEGGNLLRRERRRDAPLMVPAWIVEEGRAVSRDLDRSDPRAQQFLQTFLPELFRLLQRRGWTKLYLQGILDEPHEWEREGFVQTAELVRRLMPGVRTIEPVGARQDLSYLEKTVDIWVPQLGTFDDKLDVLERHVQRGGEVWFYTALSPRGRYMNRFIDYSLLKTRLLHWINFKHGFKGFLHWGGNYWGPEPLKDTQPVINEGRTYLPPGDAYLVYPNRLRRTFYSSIRLEQMREGIEDFGLLSGLSQRNAARAQEIAAAAVTSFTDYVRAPARFREIHRQLLTAASEQ